MPILRHVKTCHNRRHQARRSSSGFLPSVRRLRGFLSFPQVVNGEEDSEDRKHQNNCHGRPPGFSPFHFQIPNFRKARSLPSRGSPAGKLLSRLKRASNGKGNVKLRRETKPGGVGSR